MALTFFLGSRLGFQGRFVEASLDGMLFTG